MLLEGREGFVKSMDTAYVMDLTNVVGVVLLNQKMSKTVYVLVAGYYDESRVQGVYESRDVAEKAIEKSKERFSYRIKELDVLDEPQSHAPYF